MTEFKQENNPVPQEEEEEFKVLPVANSRHEPTQVSIRIEELRRQSALRQQQQALEQQRAGKVSEGPTMVSIKPQAPSQKMYLIIGATLGAIAAVSGSIIIVKHTGKPQQEHVAKNIPATAAAGIENQTAPAMTLTAPTSVPTAEPSTEPQANAELEADTEQQPTATTPVTTTTPAPRIPSEPSVYDEIENEAFYDTIDRKYPTKSSKPQPKPKGTGGIIRKAPF